MLFEGSCATATISKIFRIKILFAAIYLVIGQLDGVMQPQESA